MKLTEKQKKFCDYYIQTCNATESAIKAGYSKKTAKVIGAENLTKPYIRDYIEERNKILESKRIANAKEIQEFWTRTVRGEEEDADFKDRLKASELIFKVKMTGNLETEKLKAEIEMLKAKTNILTGDGLEIEDTSDTDNELYGNYEQENQ